jgi:hypothetical protein
MAVTGSGSRGNSGDYTSQVPAAARAEAAVGRAPAGSDTRHWTDPTVQPPVARLSSPLANSLRLPPLTPQQAAKGIYMGRLPVQFSPGIALQPQFTPKENAWGAFLNLSETDQERFNRVMDGKYGAGKWGESWRDKVWSKGVMASEQITTQSGTSLTPLDVLELQYVKGQDMGLDGSGGSGGGGGGGGGAYGGTSVSSSVRLTDPETAEQLVNASLETFLGRQATAKERGAFQTALNRYERRNPTVTQQTVAGSAAASSQSSFTTGGTNPTQFAEDWGMKQEGAAEHTAATGLLDAFMGALDNQMDVVQ